MPVSFSVAPHGSNPTQLKAVKTSAELLEESARRGFNNIERVIQSSFTDEYLSSHRIEASLSGFIDTAVRAYNQHHHHILRPDDIWQAIILQFNFYVNAHAEELRHHFVAHKDKKELIVDGYGTTDTYNWSLFPLKIAKLFDENVLDPELRTWIVPNFSTTTPDDRIVASITMMATLQTYFDYSCELLCGLPKVTLLGTRDDWVQLRTCIDELTTFGEETTKWHNLLVPIFSRSVEAFDSPKSEAYIDFWQKICHHHGGGSGPTYMTGWITAFCFWNDKGKRLDEYDYRNGQLVIGGVGYHQVNNSHRAAGWVGVPVHVNDNCHEYEARMVAGHVGTGQEDGNNHSLRPISGWWMCKVKE